MRHQNIKPRPLSTKMEPEARLGSVPCRGVSRFPYRGLSFREAAWPPETERRSAGLRA